MDSQLTMLVIWAAECASTTAARLSRTAVVGIVAMFAAFVWLAAVTPAFVALVLAVSVAVAWCGWQ